MKTTRDRMMVLALLLSTGIVLGISRSPAQMTSGGAMPGATSSPSASGSPSASPGIANQDILATLTASGQYTQLLKAVNSAGLTSLLQRPGPITVFAPNDAAFAKVPPAQLNAVLTNNDLLTKIIQYNVIPGVADSAAQLQAAGTATTQEGEAVTVTGTANALKVNNAGVVKADIQASNGVIHEVDTILIPPSLATLLGASLAGATPTASPAQSPGASASPSVSPSP